MDVYVVQHSGTGKIMGISARLQGAEMLRGDCQHTNPDGVFTLENYELLDNDDDA